MNKICTFVFVLLILPFSLYASNWQVDREHSAAHFSVQHMGIANVQGSLSNTTGSLVLYGEENEPLKLDLTIGLKNMVTGVEKRDSHLKSPDFFDTAKHSTITFHSLALPQQGKGQYKLVGNLNLHGTTKRIDLELTGLHKEIVDPWGNTRRGAQIEGVLDRRDFGLIYNAELETGELLIANEVHIVIDLEFIKEKS